MSSFKSSDEVIKHFTKKMSLSVDTTKHDFSQVRTGRASTAMVEHIHVEYYGANTPLKQLATISTPEARMLVIQPFDLTSLSNIEKAIRASELGLNPSNDGKIIRVPVPALTQERRTELDKFIKKVAEEHRVSVRNTRREANEAIKKLEKEGIVTEDDCKKSLDKIQKATDEHIKQIDELLKHKEVEIYEV
jgi:ribosome recycling factor